MIKTKTEYMEEPEISLMERVAEDDESAFETLVDRYQAGLVQYLACLTQNPVVAEDLAQEVFIRIYRHRRRYRPRARFKTFLYHVAKNIWKDHLRRVKKSLEVSLEIHEARLHAPRELSETEGSNTFEKQRPYRALGRLSVEHRSVLLLHLIEEMTHPEIANVLGIPVGTAKSRLYHAVRKLRALFTRA